MARIVRNEADEKNAMCTVTLCVADRNTPGQTQVLCLLITKIVMLVGNNEFNSPTAEPKQNVQDGSHLRGAR